MSKFIELMNWLIEWYDDTIKEQEEMEVDGEDFEDKYNKIMEKIKEVWNKIKGINK